MNTKIKLVRIDSRLLHATVALNWNKFVNANYAIIVDSNYNKDPFLVKVMKLCLPKPMEVKIFSPSELIEFLSEDTNEKRHLMIIFKNLKIAEEAVELGFWYKEIQIPYPASRIMMKKLPDFFSVSEINCIRILQQNSIKLFFQTSPMDNKEYAIFLK